MLSAVLYQFVLAVLKWPKKQHCIKQNSIPTLQNEINMSLLLCHYMSLSLLSVPVILPQFSSSGIRYDGGECRLNSNALCPTNSNICCPQRSDGHPAFVTMIKPLHRIPEETPSRRTSIKHLTSWHGKGIWCCVRIFYTPIDGNAMNVIYTLLNCLLN